MHTRFMVSAMLALLAWATPAAFADEAGAIVFDTRFSGSAVSTSIDTNGDGLVAFVVRNQGVDRRLGPVSFEEVLESAPKAGPVFCTTPDGGPGLEFALVQGHRVLQVARSGELILMAFDFDTQCAAIDPATDGSFSFQGQLSVTGGTGRFAQASGTIAFEGHGTFILVHPTGAFAVIQSAHEFGTIQLGSPGAHD